MFSGGIGSWAAAKKVAQEFGTENLYLLFTDVKGNTESPHIGEDEDTYRFIDDAVKNIGGLYIYLNEGRDIWQVFKDKRFLGSSRLAHCSFELKQIPAKKWIEANCDPATTVIYLGIDWTETHRLPAIERNYLPFVAKAPLTEPPFMDKTEMLKWAKSEGLKTPRLYDLGFSHNNCGGGCVKAGQAQWKKLYETMPERFMVWEQKEKEMQEFLDRPVTILKETRNGVVRALPLIELRLRIDNSPFLIDDLDIGGCGCFVEEESSENTGGKS